MAILNRVGILKYVSYEFEDISKLSADYRNLISKLAESKSNMIQPQISGFIKEGQFFGLDGASISDFYCKLGYKYGPEKILQNDALIFPLRRILFHSILPIGNGSINPIYGLFRDFSDMKKYKLEYKGDLSNPFQVP